MRIGLGEESPFFTINGARKLVASASRDSNSCAREPSRVPSASMSSRFPSKADGGRERLYRSLTYNVVKKRIGNQANQALKYRSGGFIRCYNIRTKTGLGTAIRKFSEQLVCRQGRKTNNLTNCWW